MRQISGASFRCRAGKDGEGKTGDGVGILTQIPHKFFKKVLSDSNITIGGAREYAVGMFFFPQNELKRSQAMKMFEIIVEKEGQQFLGWRKVPTRETVLGQKALESCPAIYQAFIKRPQGMENDQDFDRKLYVIRRVFEQSNDNTYVPSLSCRTIVYKGMFLVGHFGLMKKLVIADRLNPMIKQIFSEHGFSQEEVAKSVGKSRPAVANALRLLKLPDNIKIGRASCRERV